MSNTNISPIKILIVDDTGIVRLVQRKLLTDAGYSVDEASNGEEAINMFERGYAAIFMDINMPVMDGLMATAEIRRREQSGQRISIVGVTGYGTDREACLNVGMDEVVLKPITPEQMHKLAEKWATKRDNA